MAALIGRMAVGEPAARPEYLVFGADGGGVTITRDRPEEAMIDDRTDEIAREAAWLLDSGRAADVAHAVRSAAGSLGYADVPLPGPGRVRRHVQGRALEALGEDGYRAMILATWRLAEELLAVLEHGLDGAETLLAGRAARGHIDGGVTLHVRVYTEAAIGRVAEVLVEHGYEEPSFETADTRGGRLDRIRFVEADHEVIVTRCPPGSARGERERDLFTGKRIEVARADDLRTRLAEEVE